MVGRRENFLTLEALKTPCRDFKSDIFGLKIGSKKFFALPRETEIKIQEKITLVSFVLIEFHCNSFLLSYLFLYQK